VAATKYFDFLVIGDPVRARATIEEALVARKFKVKWSDDWTATAERGSKVANALAGALAQYFKVGVHLMSDQPGETTVRIERQSSGWLGGAIGASRTTKNLKALRTELETTFSSAGVLRGVTEG
jgi:hypothetical protein